MKIVKVKKKGSEESFYGILGDKTITRINGNILGDYVISDDEYNLTALEILHPINPPNILAIGLNYRNHAKESGQALPSKPLIFIKATSSIIGPNKHIRLPKNHPHEVDYEAELAVIIGKKASNIEPDEANKYILGYTCGNDVSARDCQKRLDAQWARAKSFDTFCPIGPWIETEIDVNNLGIRSILNGKVMQNSSTADMIFPPTYLVSYCSKNMTLMPGTIILTGTPEGVGTARNPQVFLKKGDTIKIEIDGIGSLENYVL